MFATLDDLPDGRTVLARLDLNSPVEDGTVQDNRRFERHAETIADLRDADHGTAVLAHQGRPGRETFVSLEQHADLLADHLHSPVRFCPDIAGPTAREAVADLDGGDVVMLENVRMAEDELAERSPGAHARTDLVSGLAEVADSYVGDAYSVAHRAHASIVGFPEVMDAYAGRVMAAECEANAAIQSRRFDGPVRMILGGTKADDLIRVIAGVADRVDTFLLGGVIGELCLRAEGYDLGYDVGDDTLFDPIWEEHAGDIRDLLAEYGDQLRLPSDLAFAGPEGRRTETGIEGISKDRPFFDIGQDTIDAYGAALAGSAGVFVKGAVGMFEDERFRQGTCALLERIASLETYSVVGGGDTSRAIELYGLEEAAYSHVSIAGGAYVRALAGEPLPGVTALERAASRMNAGTGAD